MATVGTAYVQIVPSAQGIKGSIEGALGGEAASAGKKAGGIFGYEMSDSVKTGLKVVGAGVAAAAGGLVALGKEAVQGYADFEQLSGGVDTLFGTGGKALDGFAASLGKNVHEVEDQYHEMEQAQKAVMENAANAYKTAGISENEYMELAIQSGAALISSLKGDTLKASSLMDMAIVDMSDNVNKMGTTMEAVQNAYKGFSKGNFTMLDNLALGYGGTKEEMARLLSDAQKLSGVEYKISNYADIVSAIHVVQESMGVAGTTAKEAESTITGSVNQTKAAWANLLTGMASGEDISGLVENLIMSAQTVLGNLTPIIEQTISGISTAVSTIIDSGAINDVISSLMAMLPDILSVAAELVFTLIGALGEAAPQLLQAGADLMMNLMQGLTEHGQEIGSSIVQIVTMMVTFLIENGPALLEAGFNLIVQVGIGILSAIGEVVGPMAQVASEAVNSFIGQVGEFIDAGVQIIKGIVQGIESAASQVWEAIKGIVSGAIGKVKEFLRIGSPSKVFSYFGEMIDAGFAKGIEDNVGMVSGAMDTLNDQTRGVQIGVQRAASSGLGIDSGIAGITQGNLGQLASAIVNGLSTQLGGAGSTEAAIYIDGDRAGRAILPSVRYWSKITPEVSMG